MDLLLANGPYELKRDFSIDLRVKKFIVRVFLVMPYPSYTYMHADEFLVYLFIIFFIRVATEE